MVRTRAPAASNTSTLLLRVSATYRLSPASIAMPEARSSKAAVPVGATARTTAPVGTQHQHPVAVPLEHAQVAAESTASPSGRSTLTPVARSNTRRTVPLRSYAVIRPDPPRYGSAT